LGTSRLVGTSVSGDHQTDIRCRDFDTVMIQIVPDGGTASILWEASIDGSLFVPLSGVRIVDSYVTDRHSTSSTKKYSVPVRGYQTLRLRSYATTGEADVTALASISGSSPSPIEAELRSDDRAVPASLDGFAPLVGSSLGKAVVLPYSLPAKLVDGAGTFNTGNYTSVQYLIAAPGAGHRFYVTAVLVSNEGSNKSSVQVQDSGGVRAYVSAPAGGGSAVSLPVPLRLADNSAAKANLSADPGGTVYVTLVGYQSEE
jgi:hypothetical protein